MAKVVIPISMEMAVSAVLGLTAFVFAVLYILSRRQKSSSPILLLQQQLDSIREQMRGSLDGNAQMLNKQLADLTTQLQGQLYRQTGTLNETRKAMDERLDNAARVIGDIQKAMGRIHEALTPVGEIKDILTSPKLRGGMGEIMLERILQEMMPASMYETQFGFADGGRVDAVIKIGGQLVPVDSKFPLDKYREYLEAPTDETKKAAKKGLISAVKKHITDVSKYIRPDEGTYPFAFMYVPSENIHYELFVGMDSIESLWPYAANARVFPVSSNTLYIYLQTISLGLKGMQIAENARELLNKIEHLQKSLDDIRKNYEKIGTHLKNAQSAYDETDKRLGKFEDKLSAINSETAPILAEPAKKEDAYLQ